MYIYIIYIPMVYIPNAVSWYEILSPEAVRMQRVQRVVQLPARFRVKKVKDHCFTGRPGFAGLFPILLEVRKFSKMYIYSIHIIKHIIYTYSILYFIYMYKSDFVVVEYLVRRLDLGFLSQDCDGFSPGGRKNSRI